MATTISVPEELADELYDRKGRGESYADVIRRLLDDDTANADDRGVRAEGVDGGPDSEPVVDQPETFDAHVDAVADDLPGSGEKHDRRVEAFEAVVEHLREHGTTTPRDLRETVYDDYPAGYSTGQSWWKNAMYPALSALADRSDAVERADEAGDWRFEEVISRD